MESTDPRRGLGARGETLATRHLERAGYRVLERNARCGRLGELDIVAAHGRVLVFCEVKTRTAGTVRGPELALEAIGPRKRLRLRRLAAAWLRGRGPGEVEARGIRFDAIGVTLDRRGRLMALDHVENAF